MQEETRQTICSCGNKIEYKASDIIHSEEPGTTKDILGEYISESITVVKCDQCNNDVKVYDTLDITGGFLD